MACHVWGDEKVGMDSEEFEKCHKLNCSAVVPSCKEPAWQAWHVEGGQWPREDEPQPSCQAKTLGIHLIPLRLKYIARDVRDRSVVRPF